MQIKEPQPYCYS